MNIKKQAVDAVRQYLDIKKHEAIAELNRNADEINRLAEKQRVLKKVVSEIIAVIKSLPKEVKHEKL